MNASEVAHQTGNEIQEAGRALTAMNDLSYVKRFVITDKQIEDISAILKLLTHLYADPAIRELEQLPEIEDVLLVDIPQEK